MIFGQERPLEPRGKARATAATKHAFLHQFDNVSRFLNLELGFLESIHRAPGRESGN